MKVGSIGYREAVEFYCYNWKQLKGQKSFQYYNNTEIKLGR